MTKSNLEISAISIVQTDKSKATHNSDEFQVFLVCPLSHHKFLDGAVCHAGSKLVLFTKQLYTIAMYSTGCQNANYAAKVYRKQSMQNVLATASCKGYQKLAQNSTTP